MSTPAAAATPALPTLIPPSISISTSSPRASISLRGGAHLVEHFGNEGLPAESGVHAHHEQQVDVGEVRLDRVVGSLRLEGETASHTQRPDLGEQRPGIPELDVNRDPVGARFGEGREQPARVVDHQVAVEEEFRVGPQRRDDRRTDREIRHVVTVHAVDVQQLRRVGDAGDAGREVREISREHRRRDLHHECWTRRGVIRRPP